MKHISILALAIVCFALIFGCTQPQNEGKSLLELEQLKAKYGITENFSSSVSEMNDYVNELSLLRAKSGGNAANTIDAELYSAQSLYYLLKSLDASVALGNFNVNCNSAEARTLKSFATLSISAADKALAVITQVNPSSLRSNQAESIQDYKTSAQGLRDEIERIC